MATLELVEKLREKTGVSYEEAKAALDAAGDDLLEAVIYLEKLGKLNAPQNGGHYTSQNEQAGAGPQASAKQGPTAGQTFGDTMSRFGRWCQKVIYKSWINQFEVQRKEHRMLSVPVLVLVILVLCCPWITLPLLVVGLFCGCRYRFVGEDIKENAVNEVIDSAANAAVNVVDQIKSELDGLSGPKS